MLQAENVICLPANWFVANYKVLQHVNAVSIIQQKYSSRDS